MTPRLERHWLRPLSHLGTLGLVIWLFVAQGCGSRGSPPIGAVSLVDQELRDIVRQAITLDAQGRPADSLYVPGATVVANGRARVFPPRFAGIGRSGVVTITSIRMEVSGITAWGTAAYRWISGDGSLREAGQASFVMQRTDSRWLIKHIHSSQVLPWESGP